MKSQNARRLPTRTYAAMILTAGAVLALMADLRLLQLTCRPNPAGGLIEAGFVLAVISAALAAPAFVLTRPKPARETGS